MKEQALAATVHAEDMEKAAQGLEKSAFHMASNMVSMAARMARLEKLFEEEDSQTDNGLRS